MFLKLVLQEKKRRSKLCLLWVEIATARREMQTRWNFKKEENFISKQFKRKYCLIVLMRFLFTLLADEYLLVNRKLIKKEEANSPFIIIRKTNSKSKYASIAIIWKFFFLVTNKVFLDDNFPRISSLIAKLIFLFSSLQQIDKLNGREMQS